MNFPYVRYQRAPQIFGMNLMATDIGGTGEGLGVDRQRAIQWIVCT